MAPGTIRARDAAVVRGVVSDAEGPLPGVRVSVLGRPEYGFTLTRDDGAFDFALNGGRPAVLRFVLSGYVEAQRTVTAPRRDYESIADIELVPFDEVVTSVVLGAEAVQVARAAEVEDEAGARRATLLFPAGLSGTMVFADGREVALERMDVRATELTVGPSGLSRMPGDLPPTSAYTYAVELSVDEAMEAGAVEVRFDEPVPFYVENFLGFPVGGAVPTGYYDRRQGVWVPSDNGRVVAIVGEAGGRALVDVDGDDEADDDSALAALGISDAERVELAALYESGDELWRVPIPHFTPWDHNWPFGPPDDAGPPPGSPNPDDPGPFEPDGGDPEPDSEDGCEAGSIVEVEGQTLREELPLPGTPFRLAYASNRVPGRRTGTTIDIPVTLANVLANLAEVEAEVQVAGRRFVRSFPGEPNQRWEFAWDGRDAYGRELFGEVEARVTVRFAYELVYIGVRSDFERAFARLAGDGTGGSAPRVSATVGNRVIRVDRTWTVRLRNTVAPAFGLGGWSLDGHHVFDPDAGVLWEGTGARRSARAISPVVTTFVGSGRTGYDGDGGPARDASVSTPSGMALGPDGALYFADASNFRVRRIGPDGIITTVAGNGVDTSAGGEIREGVPATESAIGLVQDVSVGLDSSIYLASVATGRVFVVDPEGMITTFAGGTVTDGDEEGALATEVDLIQPVAVLAAPDGSVYIGENGGRRVRRVMPDGRIWTVAGGGRTPPSRDPLPALEVEGRGLSDLAMLDDGTLLITGLAPFCVLQLGLDGLIRPFAGIPFVSGPTAEGANAVETTLSGVAGLAVAPDGSVYLAQVTTIRRVTPAGLVFTVVGTGVSGQSGESLPGPDAAVMGVGHAFVDPDGVLYFGDGNNGPNERIRRVASEFPSRGDELLVPSASGAEVYLFSARGRHLRTLDGRTGDTLLTFAYDGEGRLSSVLDVHGNRTTIERDAAGDPAAVVAASGLRTTLSVDGAGWLDAVTLPDGVAYELSTSADGLLTGLVDPAAGEHAYTYDSIGRLASDSGPREWSLDLERSVPTDGTLVLDAVSAEGRTTTRTRTALGAGRREHVVTWPDGRERRTETAATGSQLITHDDGSTTTLTMLPSPRFGMLAAYTGSAALVMPSGVRSDITREQRVEPAEYDDVFGYDRLVETVTVDGSTSTHTFDRAARTLTTVSAAGRRTVASYDAAGLLIGYQRGDELPVTYEYSDDGSLLAREQGERRVELSYDEAGHLVALVDPLGRETTIEPDIVGRPVSIELPGERALSFGYDELGNVTSLAPPGRPAYGFLWTPSDEVERVEPPDAVPGVREHSANELDRDGRLVAVDHPDGNRVVIGYDGGGAVVSVADDWSTRAIAYDAAGQVASVAVTPGPETLSFERDGMLITRQSWAGTVSGSTETQWATAFRVAAEGVNGGDLVARTYDADGYVAQVGRLSITRDPATGRVTGTSIGGVTTELRYDGYGEVVGFTARYEGTPFFEASYERDLAGRLVVRREVARGVTRDWSMSFDDADRLDVVRENGAVLFDYDWDANGNRTAVSNAGGLLFEATYDVRDRILTQGDASFVHDARGARTGATELGVTTSYEYDAFHDLRGSERDGQEVAYVIDGRGRRVGRLIGGVLERAWLYGAGERIVAELDGSGDLVSRFVYGTQRVPAYFTRRGATYDIISDHLGSPRVIIDVDTGAVAQDMEFGPFGELRGDTTPGFQPFGFAGGLWDPTRGLVRFGNRDYDPGTGRWMTPDPLGLRPSATNLYAYAAGDPVGLVDPTGLFDAPPVTDADVTRAGEILKAVREDVVRAFPAHTEAQVAAEVWARLKTRRDELARQIADAEAAGSCPDPGDYNALVLAEHRAWAADSCAEGGVSCAGVMVGTLVYDPLKAVAQGVGLEQHLRSDPDIPTSPATSESWLESWRGVVEGIFGVGEGDE